MRSFVVTGRRELMQALLTKDVFDRLLVSEVMVRKGALLTLDGHEADGGIAEYGSVRNVVYGFIKGRETPSYMKFVLLSPENPPGVTSRSVNIIFRDGSLVITSGIACRNFTTDKTEEGNWDEWTKLFLLSAGIDFQ